MNKPAALCVSLIFLLCLLSPGLAGAPRPELLKNFGELFTALKQGQEVRLVIHYEKCWKKPGGEGSPPEKGPAAVGGMALVNFEYFPAGLIPGQSRAFISSSTLQFIQHQRHGVVYNYARVRVFSDNLVEITVRYYQPQTFEVLMEDVYQTVMADRKNEGGAFFYRR